MARSTVTKSHPRPASSAKRIQELDSLLASVDVSRKSSAFSAGEVIYAQGNPAKTVFYIRQGTVKLSVVSVAGKEAIVAVLGPGDFFGEGCLAGQGVRMGSATAMTTVSALTIERTEMIRALHEEPALSERFITFMLSRNIRIEENLVDQLFNSSEKRLARTLLLLARYGTDTAPQRILHNISQETLAEIIGTTRPRVNFFMNKFRKLGFIKYNGTLEINSSLLSVVLHE
jgi:CRP/FNR family transcriptional regulator, cyclic AMP receptor protein